MRHWQDTDHSRDVRTSALALIDKFGLPSTPVYFELWFFYALGHDHDLRRALDAVIEAGEAHDQVKMKEIHTRFFIRPDQQIDRANETLHRELGQLETALTTVGEGAAAYQKTLGDTQTRLGRSDATHELSMVVRRASSATEDMQARNRALEAQVETSRRELATLRSKMEEIRQEGRTDSLTGLANRRAFDEQIESAIRNAVADRQPLCVLMCDIDHFKKFNDTWGHATGDQVLRLVAALTKANVKGKDLAARYGGEELAVILPETQLSDAIGVANRIRAVIESKKVVKKSTGAPLGRVTISIGVAQLLSSENSSDFLSRADEHLYAAKQNGRNRVSWIANSGTSNRPNGKGIGPGSHDSNGSKIAHSSAPALELEFSDQDSPLIVDAEIDVQDERLVRLLEWWGSLCPGTGLPVWSDDLLEQIHYTRDHAHLHRIEPGVEELRVQFVGQALVRALGTDPTGFRYSATNVPVSGLTSTAGRVFELARLTSSMKTPLRAYSKGVRHLESGNFNSELLFLPFAGANAQLEMLLGVTIYTPATESNGVVAA